MTPEQRADAMLELTCANLNDATFRERVEWRKQLLSEFAGHLREAECSAAARMRAEIIILMRHYLQFDNQRAVSWHEVEDCIAAILARP